MGGSSGSTTQRVEPPAFQRPYMEQALRQARDTFGGSFTPSYFPQNTVAPLSSQTQAGVGQLTQLGDSSYNQAVLNRARTGGDTLAQGINPQYNPVLAAGLGTAGASTSFLNDVISRAGGSGTGAGNYQTQQVGSPVMLGANGQPQPGGQVGQAVQTYDQYLGGVQDQTSQQAPVVGAAQGVDPTGTLNRLQTQTRNVNINVPQSQQSYLEALAGGIDPSQAIQSAINTQPGQNPYTDELIQRTLAANTQNYNENVLPQIANQAELAGGYGGSRQGVAEGIATKGLNDTNARITSEILSREYAADQARQLQAAQLGSSFLESAGAQGLARTGQDRQFGLQSAALQSGVEGEDLARQLGAAGTTGQFGLGGAQLGLSQQGQDRDYGLGVANYGLQRAGLGANIGSLEAQIQDAIIGRGLQGSSIAGNLLQTGYGQGLDSITRGLALEPQNQALSRFGADNLLQAGDIDQRYRQAVLDDSVNRFNFSQQVPGQQARDFANAAGLGGSLGASTTTPSERGGFSGAVGGAATSAALLGGATSAGLISAGTAAGPVGWAALALGALGGYFG